VKGKEKQSKGNITMCFPVFSTKVFYSLEKQKKPNKSPFSFSKNGEPLPQEYNTNVNHFSMVTFS
jgi:hypothetical protein